MKFTFYLFLFLFTFNTGWLTAQDRDEFQNSQAYIQSLSGSQSNTVLLIDERYVEIKGSPYFIADWKKGNVIDSKGTIIPDVFLKYNAYENELYVKAEKDNIIIIDNTTIKGFVIDDETIKHTFIKESIGKYKNYFFEVIGAGKVSVLKKHHINLFISDNKSGYQLEKSNTFKNNPKYFIRKNNENEYKNFKRSTKNLIKTTPSLKASIKRFLKKEKMDLNQDEDLKKTINWINKELKKQST